METTPHTESINSIIDGLTKGDIVLPEFQRDFVWDLAKNYDLFDSMVRDIFIGSIIYGVPSFEVTTRELDIRPRKGKGSRRNLELKSFTKDEIEEKVKTEHFRLILDGQQRITSIYRALLDIDEVWFICKYDSELSGNGDVSNLDLEDILYEFTGQEDEERLSIKLSDVYSIMKEGYFEDDIKKNFFDRLKYHQSKDGEEIKTVFRRFLIITRKIQDLFKREKLVSYYLLNTSTEKFALFFERSNSKGIQLNFIDILAAKLYVGFNLRQKIEEFEEEYPEFELNREIIVRAIAYIVTSGKEINRSSILAKLNAEHFDSWWDVVCTAFKDTLEFLSKNNFLINQNWLPYENMIIPLMMFYLEIGKDFSQMDERQFDFIKYWYWASIFSQRYTSSSNEMIIQDSRILEKIAVGNKITDKSYFQKLRSIITSADDLFSYSKKGSVIYKGILNLINFHVQGFIDWKNSSKLNFNSKLDDHHIFPKEYLRKNNSQLLPNMIDTVVNRTLIPKITNIKIGSKKPSVYLQELSKDNPNLEQSLTNHLIDPLLIGGTLDDEYDEFINKRAKAIFEIIDNLLITNQSEIINQYYENPQTTSSAGKISIFAKYNNTEINAELDLSDYSVIYNDQIFNSVSGAAEAAKKDISGNSSNTNGWEFWKYIDEQDQEKIIDNLRKN
ncbi:MAG: DUF262 domain-containing protein [Ignavibacteria bacterium]|jgi:hypothetical protein